MKYTVIDNVHATISTREITTHNDSRRIIYAYANYVPKKCVRGYLRSFIEMESDYDILRKTYFSEPDKREEFQDIKVQYIILLLQIFKHCEEEQNKRESYDVLHYTIYFEDSYPIVLFYKILPKLKEQGWKDKEGREIPHKKLLFNLYYYYNKNFLNCQVRKQQSFSNGSLAGQIVYNYCMNETTKLSQNSKYLTTLSRKEVKRAYRDTNVKKKPEYSPHFESTKKYKELKKQEKEALIKKKHNKDKYGEQMLFFGKGV